MCLHLCPFPLASHWNKFDLPKQKKREKRKEARTHFCDASYCQSQFLFTNILILLSLSFFFFFSFAPSLFYSLAWVLYKIQSHKSFLINTPLLLCSNFTKQNKKRKWNKTELTEPTGSYYILQSVNLFEQNVDLCWS